MIFWRFPPEKELINSKSLERKCFRRGVMKEATACAEWVLFGEKKRERRSERSPEMEKLFGRRFL